MNESDFWSDLEYRLCDEMDGNTLANRHGLWCDGISRAQSWLDGNPPRMEGTVWMDQEEWHFTLWLPHTYASESEIDWSALLPAEDVTDWLAVDVAGKRIEIRPGEAVACDDHERASLMKLQHAVQRIALSASKPIAHLRDFVAVPEGLALDFDNWFQVCKACGYLPDDLPDILLLGHLQLLDTHLDAMSGEREPDLWTLKALHAAPEWKEARALARRVLRVAGWPECVPPTPEQEGDGFMPAGK